MRFWLKAFAVSILFSVFFNGCAYFNTFYNAKTYYAEAQKATNRNQSGLVSRDEIQLYAKAIEKSKKLLTKYPKSKYTDDAQFIIARSYYYRQDYRLARRYFEELPKQYPGSPYAAEVPLWLGRCLLHQDDLVMAKHEARRTLEKSKESRLHVESYLLLGQIAIAEDSLDLARNYLTKVIDESDNGETRARAQFQIGNLLRQAGNYDAALEAFQRVTKYDPNESMKIQAIINQNRMLQKLGREDDDIKMIETMLLDDKFADIQGQLEVELGKAYFNENRDAEAISRFQRVMDEFRGKPYAAEAAYRLGELYLNHQQAYTKALDAYNGVAANDRKSEFKPFADQRKHQINRYEEIQWENHNLRRQLAGLEPETKQGNRGNRGRNTNPRSSHGARPGHGRAPVNQDLFENPDQQPAQTETAPSLDDGIIDSTQSISTADSIKFTDLILKNRYALAEHFVFSFHFYDSTLVLLNDIEKAGADSALKIQAAYMRYYLASEILKDSLAADSAKAHIRQVYPAAYTDFFVKSKRPREPRAPEVQFRSAEAAFLSHNTQKAAEIYQAIVADTTGRLSPWRERALFNLGWVYDHFLYDHDKAIAYYGQFGEEYPHSRYTELATERLNLLTADKNIRASTTATEPEPPQTVPSSRRDRNPGKAEHK